MGKNKEQIAGEFSREIFGAAFTALDIKRQFFVFSHMREYDDYRDRIVKYIRQEHPAANNLLGGSSFAIIREWYYHRIHSVTVLNEIRNCLCRRPGTQIRGFKYFDVAVRAEQVKQLRLMVGGERFGNLGDEYPQYGFAGKYDKYYWTAYVLWSEGKLDYPFFDLWEGPNMHNGERRSNVN